MALEQPDRPVFPADIHQIAADIRRQALQHPDKDPVVPRAPRQGTKTTKAKSRTTKSRKTKSRKTRARKTTRARRK